jgi:hypothetical protein
LNLDVLYVCHGVEAGNNMCAVETVKVLLLSCFITLN